MKAPPGGGGELSIIVAFILSYWNTIADVSYRFMLFIENGKIEKTSFEFFPHLKEIEIIDEIVHMEKELRLIPEMTVLSPGNRVHSDVKDFNCC